MPYGTLISKPQSFDGGVELFLDIYFDPILHAIHDAILTHS